MTGISQTERFVGYNPPLERRQRFVRLDFNENLRGPSSLVYRSLQEVGFEDLSTYPSYDDLYDQLAESLDLDREGLVLTAGIDDGLRLIFDVLLGKGQKVLTVVPTFSMYHFYGQLKEAEIIEVPLEEDFSFPVEEIVQVAVREKPKVVILSDPNNPTGSAIPEPEYLIEELERKCPETVIVIDEAYGEFGINSYADLVKSDRRLIVLKTFSKAFGLAGLRIGYAYTNKEIAYQLKIMAPPYNVNSLAVHAVKAALKDIPFVERYVEEVKQSRRWVMNQLREMSIEVFPSYANFLLVRFGTINKWICKKLEQKGILIRDRSNQKQLEGYSRITIGPLQIMKRFVRTLQEILEEPVLIFDMDGVLVDVRKSYDRTIKYVVERFTGRKIQDKDIQRWREKPGYNSDWKVTSALISETATVSFEEVKKFFQKAYLYDPGFRFNEEPLIDKRILSTLSQRYRMGIVTGRPKEEVEWACERFGFDMFHVVISLDDVYEDKPDPEGIRKALAVLKAKRGYYFGDTINDVMAAKRAGITPILVSETTTFGEVKTIPNLNKMEEIL
ncbi:MAG: histidinol-phosphate transaminase [Methanobacteriota archaeon]|nr:MAG: histidinol-phosphate transaminase [Euryarchaeota archaeon]